MVSLSYFEYSKESSRVCPWPVDGDLFIEGC